MFGINKGFVKKTVKTLGKAYASESSVKSATYRVRREHKDMEFLFYQIQIVQSEGYFRRIVSKWLFIYGQYSSAGCAHVSFVFEKTIYKSLSLSFSLGIIHAD